MNYHMKLSTTTELLIELMILTNNNVNTFYEHVFVRHNYVPIHAKWAGNYNQIISTVVRPKQIENDAQLGFK